MNSKEEGFLQQIFDDPEDEAVRLIYADWLDDHEEGRGELVRLRCELEKLPPNGHGVKKLRRREQELVSHCDEQWLILLERADWKRRYLALSPRSKNAWRWRPTKQLKISQALQAFETEFACKLPRSYKAYAHVFGPGEMASYFRINVPCVVKTLRGYYELSDEHRRACEDFHSEHSPKWQWLRRAIWFATTIGGEQIIWNTSVVTDAVAHEYRVCWLTRSQTVHRSADSFSAFIDEICLKVFDDEGEPTPQEFHPY